jgi:hypothetical protein
LNDADQQLVEPGIACSSQMVCLPLPRKPTTSLIELLVRAEDRQVAISAGFTGYQTSKRDRGCANTSDRLLKQTTKLCSMI